MVAPKPVIDALRKAAKQDKELTCLEAAALTGYAADHISLMLRTKKLKGEKRGRDWRVHAKSLFEHVQKKPTPGRKAR